MMYVLICQKNQVSSYQVLLETILGEIRICTSVDVFHGVFLNDWSLLFLEQGSQVWPTSPALRVRVVRASHNSPQRYPFHHQPLGLRLLLPESVTHRPRLLPVPEPCPRSFSNPKQNKKDNSYSQNKHCKSIPGNHGALLAVSAWDQFCPHCYHLSYHTPAHCVCGAYLLHLSDQRGDQLHHYGYIPTKQWSNVSACHIFLNVRPGFHVLHLLVHIELA